MDRFDRDRDGYFGRSGRDSSRQVEERGCDSRGDNLESTQLGRDRGGKSRDAKDRDRDDLWREDRDDRQEDGDRRGRAWRDDRREGEDRRDRWFREEGNAILGKRTPVKPKGTSEERPQEPRRHKDALPGGEGPWRMSPEDLWRHISTVG